MISAARSSGARSDVLEQITHNARGAIIDVYTAWEWPALCEAVSCLRVDPERLPGRIYDISYDICVSQNANPRQSLRLFGGGGGNRTHAPGGLMFSSSLRKGVWISLCAAKSRPSDRDHGGKGGVGGPKFPGKVPSEVNARASPAARKSHRANCSG